MLDSTDTRLPNVKIELFLVNADSTTTKVGEATTGADGSYLFDDTHNVTSGDLQSGRTYRIVQTPPIGDGYVSSATQVLSQVYNANPVAGSTNAIDAAMAGPSGITATYTAAPGTFTTPFDRIKVQLLDASGSSVVTERYLTLTERTYSLSGNGTAPDPNTTPFATFCAELPASAGTGVYAPTPISGIPGYLPVNFGQIAYLYNHYGTVLDQPSKLPASVQSLPIKARISGMQLALWTLEYGDKFQIVNYDSQDPGSGTTWTGAEDFQNLLDARDAFLADAQGKSELGIYLDPVNPTDTQGVIAMGSYNFANIKPPFQNITISSTKFNDITGDGFSADDTPLGGVTVNLFRDADGDGVLTAADGAAVASATTAADGSYSFSDLGPGTYFVQEVILSGSVQTGAPAYYTVNAASGVNVPNENFADFQYITISGTKFTDITGNGFSADDTPLAGVTINLYKNGGTAAFATTTTDANGSYSFSNLGPGTYSVQEVVPAGSTQTGGVGGYTVMAQGGTDATVKDFANFQLGSISGVKFNDLNGDGVRQSGENGLPGWTIQLLDTSNNVLATTVTAADGSYSFNGLQAGTYRVREVGQAGWVQMSVNSGDVTITSGTVVSIGEDFGNFQLVSITGRKVNDLDGDGYDASDPGLGGVTINPLQGNDAAGAPIATATTASDGTYRFDGLTPGTYFVQEVVPTGWVQTEGNNGYVVTVGGLGASSGTTVSDENFANFRNPLIDIEKTTDGPTNANPIAPTYHNEDTPDGLGVPMLTPGSTLIWTYQVTNTGTVPFARGDVAIVDDNGTPGDTTDDFSVANGRITFQSELSGNGDDVLDPGEVWIYTAAGIVKDLSTPGASSTFDFSGNSSTYGTAGNIRTFNAGSVSVHASAFSRDKATGTWSTAYLGSYSGGPGVTDGSEGQGLNNSHTVDNIGRDNYVLFEFSQNVIADSAFLGYVVGDSDMKIWIGTKADAFNSHITLSDAALASLGFSEVNLTNSSKPRLADFNAGNFSGNVLVIAADPGDTTSDDQFKIQNITVATAKIAVYENTATVTALDAPRTPISAITPTPARRSQPPRRPAPSAAPSSLT